MPPVDYVADVVAIAIACGAAVYARRSARAAERNVEAQTRPLLTDVQREYYTTPGHDVIVPTGRQMPVARSGELLWNAEEGWLSVPVRNGGRGVAKLGDAELTFAEHDSRFRVAASQLARQLDVPPGGEVRLGVLVPREDPAFEALRDALTSWKRLTLIVDYTDGAGRQKERARVDLDRLPSETGLRVVGIRHERG